MASSETNIELSRAVDGGHGARSTSQHSSRTHHTDETSVSTSEVEQPSLPPVDGGKAAWLVLAGCCLIQAPVWGFPLSFGIFQEYYTSGRAELKGSTSSIAVIGTSASGILYLSAPIMFTLLTRYPRMRRFCGPVGLVITVVSLVLSSLASSVWQLIATQGVLCAIGSGLLYSPTTLYLDEWFIRRKGLAYGVMGGAKSLTGVVLPFIMSASLEKYGFRTTLRAWAVALFLMTSPLLMFLKPRLHLPATSAARPLDWSLLKSNTFWMLQTGNIIQSLGYFLPTTYLASYAARIGLTNVTGTLMVSILNATSVFGSVLIGILNDHMRVTNVILITTIGSTLAVIIFWGLYTHVAMLAVFAIIYGFFAGGYSSTWPGIQKTMKDEIPSIETGLVFGLLAGGRGIGNVISGPLSVLLLEAKWPESGKSFGFNTEYGPVILFTGATALFGGWSWIWRTLEKAHIACSVPRRSSD
ncbi:MAG: hypothetical protein M4579_002978 [Chaenotheca gracillima]|nr:MAG: hypothetical protein M4579_002978 [Chaenotheca gracillima]